MEISNVLKSWHVTRFEKLPTYSSISSLHCSCILGWRGACLCFCTNQITVDHHYQHFQRHFKYYCISCSYQSLSNDSVSDVSIYTEDPVEHQVPHRQETDALTSLKFDPANLSYIDHRLKLHLTVSYFEDHERPECTVRVSKLLIIIYLLKAWAADTLLLELSSICLYCKF